MSGAGRDQSFQDYMNKRMLEDAGIPPVEMQEVQAKSSYHTLTSESKKILRIEEDYLGHTQAGSGIFRLASSASLEFTKWSPTNAICTCRNVLMGSFQDLDLQ